MAVYLVVYVLSFALAFCYSKTRDKYACVIFKFLVFLTLFLPLAFRYDIGTDYATYEHHVNRALRSGDLSEFETGWILVLWILQKFNLDVQFFFIIPALFSILIVLDVVPRRHAYVCVPAYVCVQWIESFSLVRQAFAVTVFLLSIKNLLERKYARCAVWAFVSVLFHKSAFLLCLLLPVCSLRLKIFSPGRNGVLFVALMGFIYVSNFASVVMEKVVSLTPYAWYLKTAFNRQAELGTGLGVLLKELVFLVVLVFAQRSGALPKDKLYNIVCLAAFSMGAAHILATQIHIFNRIPNVLSSFYLLYPILLGRNAKYRRLTIPLYLFLLFVLFFRTVTSAHSALSGGLGIVPYKSILAR